MKKKRSIISVMISATLMSLMFMTSCKKEVVEPTPEFPSETWVGSWTKKDLSFISTSREDTIVKIDIGLSSKSIPYITLYTTSMSDSWDESSEYFVDGNFNIKAERITSDFIAIKHEYEFYLKDSNTILGRYKLSSDGHMTYVRTGVIFTRTDGIQ